MELLSVDPRVDGSRASLAGRLIWLERGCSEWFVFLDQERHTHCSCLWDKSEEGVVDAIMGVDLLTLGMPRFFGFMGDDTRQRKMDAKNTVHWVQKAWLRE